MSPTASACIVHRLRPLCLRAACVILLAGLMLPAPAAAEGPGTPLAQVKISVSPSSGAAGMTVTVSGSGYTPGGYPGTLLWDGATMMTFPIPGGGAFSVAFDIPGGASPGNHTITVCATCGGGEFEQKAEAIFRVLAPPTLPPIVPPILPPTVVGMPAPPTPTETPTACSTLRLDPAARTIDFEADPGEALLDNAYLARHGVRFLGSAQRIDPAVRTRSGAWAAQSLQTEFGSSDNPVRLDFPAGVQAIGMYAGMEAARETIGTVTAVLQAYGFRAGASDLVLLGKGTATFPARSEPIRNCVSFTAADGDIISRATLDYQDATGRSILEPRLIDDVTVVPTSLTLPEDRPPVVEILAPEDGQVFRDGELVLQARIREDRSLAAAYWRIDWSMGSTGGEVGADPTGGPGEYQVTLRRSVEGFLMAESENTLVVTAVDAAGQRGEDRVTVHYVPPPALDLEIVGVEATQATQCLNRSDCEMVPLIAGRPTLVRAYLRAASGGPAAGITGELCYWLPGETPGECVHRLEPLWSVEAVAEADPTVAHRGELRRTLNFLLPEDAVRRSGTLFVQVRLNPEHLPEECCYENNEIRPAWITILPEERLDVAFIPVSLEGVEAPLNQRWRLVDWLLRAYPVTRVQVWEVEGGEPLVVDPLARAGWEGAGNLWDVILYQLWWLNAWTDDPVDGLRYYGMVPDFAQPMSGGIGGMAYVSGDESAGIVPATELEGGGAARYEPDYALGSTSALMVAGHVAGEELGHTYGRRHATAACGAANPDAAYPVPEGRLDDWGTDVRQVVACGAPGPVLVDETGRITEGFDACNQALYDPNGAHDYMGYCDIRDRSWTSMYTYRAMISAIGSAALPASGHSLAAPLAAGDQNGNVLVGGGFATPERMTLLGPLYLLPEAESPEFDMASGPYRAILLSATDERLAEEWFGPVETSNDEPGTSGSVYLRLPWPAGATAVAFEYEGREIGRVAASAYAPQVRLISPNGGETWQASGTKRIRWEAQDADGDALTAVVQYSLDDGASWRAVAVDVADDQISVDLAGMTGSPQARVRITVTDGFNTASDMSDASFSVEGKPPDVHLASPGEGAVFPYGWPVLLEGFALDREDGMDLNAEAASWESSIDGIVGQGDWLLAEGLSPGRHRLTMTVTDSSGMAGAAEVHIIVLNPDGSEPPGPAPEPPLAWVIGLAAIGVLGAVLVIGAVFNGLAARASHRSRRGAG